MCIVRLDLLFRFNLNVQIDLDLLVLEVVVQGKGRPGLWLSSLGASNEHLGFQQNAEIWLEHIRCKGRVIVDILIRQGVVLVEKQKYTHLVCRHLEGV